MEGTYTPKDDDRILLRPPSSVGSQTTIGYDVGFENPGLVPEDETEFENGRVTRMSANGVANGNIKSANGGHILDDPEADEADDDDDNPSCGWFRCRPNCLQCCNNIKGYTLFLSIFVIAHGMTVNGLVYVVITTLEKRFGFTSVRSGFISSSYDFTVMVIIIFVTYLGEKAHKPVWIGIGALIFCVGSIVFTLPHFTTGLYEYQNEDFELCDTNRTDGACDNTVSDSSLVNYYGVFILAQVIHGIGASPLYTLGITYIDDNVSSASSGLYIGVFKSVSILGPAIGYILGGVFLGYYTDVSAENIDITSADPTWVGAWWAGFLLAAFISLSMVIPFFAFPRSLPGGKKIFAQREVETQKGVEFETETGWKAIKSFPKAVWMLVKNLPFMFNSLSMACETFSLVAVGVFGPKYMESQFNLTAGQAAILAGIIVTPSSFVGAIFGGWVVKQFKLKFRGMVRFNAVVLTICFALQFVFLISCENVPFAGVTVGHGTNPVEIVSSNITTSCNGDCMCTDDFQPLCGEDSIMYYSPCHAGCTAKGDNSDNTAILYSDCACIPPLNATDGTPLGGGEGGRCDIGCRYQTVWIAVAFILIVVSSMIAVPQLTATLRCVSSSQRTFSLGVQSVIYRCLGSIPAPIVFGSLIDGACLIWEDECDGSRTCWMYDNAELSRYTLILLQVGKGISILATIMALVTYRPSKKDDEVKPMTTTTTTMTERGTNSKEVEANITRIEDYMAEKDSGIN